MAWGDMGALSQRWSGLLALAFVCASFDARAANCGDDDCGPHGSCRLSSLVPRCDCDMGYISVSTFRAPSSMGAHCVPMAAPPSNAACASTDCGLHGVCVAGDGGSGSCACDPGFRAAPGGSCEDDPNDDSEAACSNVDCSDGMACMPTTDAVTCRCTNGGDVVLGAGVDGGFGPVCSTPPDPATACGPDACGPYGSCVISQAIFCDCEEGAEQEDHIGPDGKPHPYCVRPGEPVPLGDAGSSDADPQPNDSGTSVPEEGKRASAGCGIARDPTGALPTLICLFTAFSLISRRKRGDIGLS